jgi:competence protein ComEA
VLDIHHRRRDALLAVVLVLALLLVVGKLLTRAGTPHAAAPAVRPVAAARSAAGAVVVDVVGAVRRPGLYRLRNGDRVADAVTRAGGVTRRADLEQINLAAPLADGQQVVVPRRGTGGGAAAGGSAPAGPVHLSTATVEELDALPGVGPVTAQKIVDYRRQHGGFHSLEELDAIPGIGPARIEQLKGLVTP